jgi:hypothetical protein
VPRPVCHNVAVTTPGPPAPEWVVVVPTAPERRRPRWWLVAFFLAWALVLAGGIVWSVRKGTPTAREQTTVAEAVPVVDLATVQLVAAATADGLAAVAVSGFERTATCSVTVFRSGARYQRVVTAAVATGTELALLRRVAERLPASYRAVVTTATGSKLKADAGLFVAVTGTVAEPGRVRLVVDTGDCRPEGDVPETGSQPSSAAAPAADVLTRLRTPATSWIRHDVSCPGGGALSTVEGVGSENDLPDAIDALLGRMDGLVVATPDLYAFHDGQTDVMVRIEGSRLVASLTNRCLG